jgi:hypothetical protein
VLELGKKPQIWQWGILQRRERSRLNYELGYVDIPCPSLKTISSYPVTSSTSLRSAKAQR